METPIIITAHEEHEIEVGKIDEESIEYMLFTFRHNLGDLIFRRVETVALGDVIESNYVDAVGLETVRVPLSQEEKEELCKSKHAYDHHFEELYKHFTFTTSKMLVRKNDCYVGRPIIGRSYNFCSPNLVSFTLGNTEKTYVAPRKGDLVCGFVKSNDVLSFSKWFICSEQFMRVWQLVMFGIDEYIKGMAEINPEKEDDEFEIRRCFMKGNFLSTNSYRRYMLACAQNNISLSEDFVQKEGNTLFHNFRTERYAREYNHVYAALVMIMYFKEYPNYNNMPVIYKYSPQCYEWDLPQNYVDRLEDYYEFEWSICKVKRLLPIFKISDAPPRTESDGLPSKREKVAKTSGKSGKKHEIPVTGFRRKSERVFKETEFPLIKQAVKV